MVVLDTEVVISREEYTHWDNCIKNNELDGEEFNPDETYFSITGEFKNGYAIVVEVFTGNEDIMSSAYLYNAEQECVQYAECDGGLDECYQFDIINDENIEEDISVPVEYGIYTLNLKIED